jgi:hypothetical protein
MKCIRPDLCTRAERIDATVALCACFRERSGSNLGQVIVLDWGFSLLSSVFWVHLYKYRAGTLLVRHQFLRDIFQHMNHAVIRRCVAWITDIVFRYPTQTILFFNTFRGETTLHILTEQHIRLFFCMPSCTLVYGRRQTKDSERIVGDSSGI